MCSVAGDDKLRLGEVLFPTKRLEQPTAAFVYRHCHPKMRLNCQRFLKFGYILKEKNGGSFSYTIKKFSTNSELDEKLFNFNDNKRQRGRGLNLASPDEKIERLSLLFNSQSAGNICDELYNEASQIIDKLNREHKIRYMRQHNIDNRTGRSNGSGCFS